MAEEATKNEQLATMLEKLRDRWPDLDSGIDNIDAIIEDSSDIGSATLDGAKQEIESLKEELEQTMESLTELEKFIKKNFTEE